MSRWIEPSGPHDAELVVIGRDCGWEEMRDGHGFVGASGKLIWHPQRQTGAADLAGIKRHETLVTNVVNTQPLHNDWSKHAQADITRGEAEALALIREHSRQLVVALGEQAVSLALTGSSSGVLPDTITNIRGYPFADTACGAPVLALVHPAFILRNWHPWWATFCWDWQKAARLASGGYQPPRFTWELAPSQAGTHELLCGATTLSCDIETSGTGCIAFSSDGEHAIVFPGKPAPDHPHADAIQALLACPAAKIFQNGQFDVTMLERVGWRTENWAYDTMLMWHALEPLIAGSQKDESESGRKGAGSRRTEKGLRFLASLLTDAPFWKDYDFQHDDQQFELCARDACTTWACWKTLRAQLDA